ncbi:MAG TPA: cytochrome c oxidase assembly protein, partial [Gaiellaceae bacterium]|nr:cytochrome c oxidase assembly protein [Gaiellaceae bacterium]
MSPTDFSFEPAYLVLAGLAAVAYAWQRPHGKRIALFALGLFLIAAPLNSPLETIAAHRLLLIHLLRNALIADIAPLFVLLGLTPAMVDALNRHGGSHIRARYALPLWLSAWYGTHLANFYDWALRTNWALSIEHALLIAGGLLFWWPLISRRLSTPAAL